MNNYLALTKVFMKSIAMSTISNKRKRLVFNLLLAIVVLCIFLPFILISGVFVYSSTISLYEVGFETIGLELLCIILSIFSFTFSFNVLLNQLYFSEDLEQILPLPIKQQIVLLSKFTACFIAENIMQFLLLIVSVIAYCLALQLSFKNFLFSIVGIFTLPIIPMVYCAIISILLMNFTKIIKNKETIRKISIVIMIIVLLLFINSIGYLQQFNFDKYVESFALGNHKFLDIMRIIFPHIYLFVDSITNCSIGSLLLYIVTNALYIVVLLVLGKLFYYKSLIGLSVKDTSSISDVDFDNISKSNIFKSYLSKEFKILFRSPTYFINCILINILWPVFVYVIYKIGFSDYGLYDIVLGSSSTDFLQVLLMFVVGVSIVVPALNSIGSSSFSREGNSFYFMKYIPVKYSLQWFIKVAVSFLISFIGINFIGFSFYFVIGVSISNILYLLLISSLCILFMSFLGVLIDSIQPKLIWDDEANSLRENYNTFMVMGFALLISILLILGIYYLIKIKMSYLLIALLLFIVLVIGNLILLIICLKNVTNNIISQEEL